jgi:hypothetical protein
MRAPKSFKSSKVLAAPLHADEGRREIRPLGGATW